MPTSTFDTFFACTIILAAALIATGFVTSTMQTRIDNTKNMNQQSYLQAIADHIVTSPGTPGNWGTSSLVPTDFGLAATPSPLPYVLDADKITRLNSLNNDSISYFDLENAAKLNNLALGITVSQIMTIDLGQPSNYTSGSDEYFTFSVSTSIDSEPVSASLSAYVVANNYLYNVSSSTSNVGCGYVTVQIPTSATSNALVIVFGRASFDDRITSYAIYNFADSSQETAPSSSSLTLSPLNHELNFITNSSRLTIQKSYVFSYTYQRTLTYTSGDVQCAIPNFVDKSPLILVACGTDNGIYFQQWVSYPQVPLKAGSDFSGSQQNVFSYTVTVNGVLYKLDVSLGGLP